MPHPLHFNGNNGFNEFEFGFEQPTQRPFVICRTKSNNSNDRKYIKKIKKNWDLVDYGQSKYSISESENSIYLKVTGKNNVKKILEKLNARPYAMPRNVQHLVENFSDGIAARKHKPLIPALLSKKTTDFSQPQYKKIESNPTHSITRFKKIGTSPSVSYIYKKMPDIKNGEYEALAAAISRLIIGPHGAPRTYSIYNEVTRQRTGVASQEFLDYKSLLDLIENKQPLNGRQMIAMGIAPLLVASYVIEENDLNVQNFGTSNNKLVRIDFDRAFWPATSKNHTFPPEIKQEFDVVIVDRDGRLTSSGKTYPPPAQSSLISGNDLINFPRLTAATPVVWFNDYPVIADLQNDPEFIKQKWKYFLKTILLCDQPTTEGLAKNYLGTTNAQNKFLNHFTQRLANLKQQLLNLPEFNEYVATNPQVLNELITEFNTYNSDQEMNEPLEVKSENGRQDLVNIQQIETSFQTIYSNAQQTTANYFNDQRTKANYIYFRDIFINTIKTHEQTNPDLYKKLTKLWKTTDQLHQSATKDEKNQLIDVLNKTLEILTIDKLDENLANNLMQNYNTLAITIKTKPSTTYRILGSVMMAIGAIICAIGGLMIAGTAVPTFGASVPVGGSLVGVGAALCVAGLTLFRKKISVKQPMNDILEKVKPSQIKIH